MPSEPRLYKEVVKMWLQQGRKILNASQSIENSVLFAQSLSQPTSVLNI